MRATGADKRAGAPQTTKTILKILNHPSFPSQSPPPMLPHAILNAIDNLPRIPLARKNTPFEEMPRLRAAIAQSMDADISDVPPLFIKRDDTTGFAFGGNKARHMEFFFAHLIQRGIDTLVNINHYDSNNARLIAAAAAKTGMKYHWVAYEMPDEPIQGNMLIAHLAGAHIHRVADRETADHLANQLRVQELASGRNATIVSQNPFFDIAGMIAYLETAHEIDNHKPPAGRGGGRQSPLSRSAGEGQGEGDRGGQKGGVPQTTTSLSTSPTAATTNPLSRSAGEGQGEGNRGGQKGGASHSAPTHFWGLCGRSIAGIILYAKNTGKPWTATAVAQPHYNPENYQQIYLDRSNRVANLLNLDTPLQPDDITTLTGYTKTYGVPTDLGIQAMHLVAQTESIILDPTYTAKSMSALIAEIQKGNLDPQTPTIFIHSGGLPQTFAFPNQIWNY